MANIIVATEEQIQEAVFNAVSKFFSGNQQVAPSSDLPDTLSMPNALKVLEDNGFPTSKAKLYKMTSQEQIPFMKYGNKLVFSRKVLIEWAHKQLVSNSSEGCDSAANIQKLPILLLVSEERNTGKSTFLNFLKAMFRNNVTFNTNEDFRSQFNSDWAGKLIIVVDEVLLNRREGSERLKNLSTTLSYKKVEAKG